MSLVYDATGRKWFKNGEFGTTSYDSGIEYHNGKLEAIYAPDGRMVAEYTGGYDHQVPGRVLLSGPSW